jgi:hypothetical protein
MAIASLAGVLFCASAAEGGAPAAQDPADAAEAIAPMLVRIEKARIGADPQPALVTAVLKEALAAIDNVEAAIRTSRASIEESIAREPRKQASRQQAAERQRLRIREVQAALARGDVYRLAALALPKDSPDRAEYLGRAIQVFDALRVEYRDLTVGLLGYIGEARAQRAAGRLDAAAAALKPVLSAPADSKEAALMEVRRAAFLELLEISLASDPGKALAEAAGLAQSAAIKDAALWQARIDYAIARAEAAEVEKAAAAGPLPPSACERAARAAAILRREAVVQIAPAFDRMALLANLDRLSQGTLLARDELIQWADMLAATGRPESIDAYRRALAGGPLPVEQSAVCISLLTKQGKFSDAADACDDLLKRMDPAHAQRGTVLQCRAAALLKLLQTVQPPSPDQGGHMGPPLLNRAAEALRAAFESTLDAAVRRDALRQWVALQGSRGSLASCVATLQANPALVSGDPYLEYSLVAGKWQESQGEESGRRGDSSTGAEDTIATVQARGIADEAAALEKSAAQGNQPGMAARAALLRAQVLAGSPLHDSRTALTVLTAQWDALRAEPETAAPAGWLRVELMMDLGLVDAASKALAELPDGGSPDSPLALLRLAEALAGRAAGMPAQAQGEVQREVLKFTGRAMSMAVSDPATFRAVRERAARAMFAAGAIADAQRVLTDLLAEEETRKDPRAFLDNSLLLAQALERAGKPEESLKRLDGLTDPKTGPVPGRYADSAPLFLARSRCQTVLGQHEQAVASARQARGLSTPGSEEWCRATLALAEGLAAQGNTQAAADILRVAAALYPTFANTELRGKLKQLRENLETLSAKQGRTPAATRENPL